MKIIKRYFKLPKALRSFIGSYNSSIDYFKEAVKYYKQDSNNATVIKNTDL